MSEEEKKAIEDLKNILKYWQTIVDIEDDIEREIEMNCYSEEMPFKQLKIALNLIEKLQKERDIYYYEWKTLEADLINNDIIQKGKIKKLIVTLGQHKNDKIDVTITYKDAIDTAITALGELLEEE